MTTRLSRDDSVTVDGQVWLWTSYGFWTTPAWPLSRGPRPRIVHTPGLGFSFWHYPDRNAPGKEVGYFKTLKQAARAVAEKGCLNV